MSGYEDKDTEIFGTNSLYNSEVHIRAQKKTEKSSRIIWKLSRKALIFAPASREKHCFGAKENGSEKFWKKVPKSFGDSEIWLTFAPASNKTECLKRCEKRFWKNSEKSFEKIWWFKKYDLSLHHFPLKNCGQNNGESRKAETDKKKEIVLYSDIIEQRSLKYLSS